MILLSTFIGCSSSGGDAQDSTQNTTTISKADGMSQKGPFEKGSHVVAYKLKNGQRTTQHITTQTFNNAGSYVLKLPWKGPTEIVITGNYLDELNGEIQADGNLNAVINAQTDGSVGANINIFTTIAAARIKKMLQNGTSFNEANTQAQALVQKLFNLELANGIKLTNLDMLHNNTDAKADNARLLQVSAALQASQNPKALLNALIQDASDGSLDDKGEAAFDTIVKNSTSIDLESVGKIISDYSHYSTVASSPDLLKGKIPLDMKISFKEIVDAEPQAQYFTHKVPLNGFEGKLNISISGSGAHLLVTKKDGTTISLSEGNSLLLEAGSLIGLSQLASSSYQTTKQVTLHIGGRDFIWGITTKSDPNSLDITPNIFILKKISNVEPSSYVLSNEIVVSGLSQGQYVDLNISGGSYSLNGQPYTTTATRVLNGDSIKVRVLTSYQFLTKKSATLNIGGVNGEFTTYTRPKDITPNSFQPQTIYNVELHTNYTTPYFLMNGYEGGLDLNITNGEAQLEGESTWTHYMHDFPAGYKVRFRQNSSSEFNTKKTTQIQLGSYITSFETLTKINPDTIDTIPNPVIFPTRYNVVPLNGEVISDEVVLSGMAGGNGATIKALDGAYIQVNGAEWTKESVTGVMAGDIIRVKRTNVHEKDALVTVVVAYKEENSAMQQFGYFKAYTAPADTTPDPINFQSITDANLFETYTSNKITISGLDEDVTLTATIVGELLSSNYQYNLNQQGWQNAPATITLRNDDTLQLRVASSSQQGKTESIALNYNKTSAIFSVTTNIAPRFSNKPNFNNIEVDDNIRFTPIVRDTQSVTFSLENAPAWLDINVTTGEISGKVASGDYKDVKLIATDSGGLSSYITFDLFANIAPTLSSEAFKKEFILDDNAPNPHQYPVSFTIEDADTDLNALSVTMSHEITEERVPAGSGVSSGFNESKVICDLNGNCSALIAIDFPLNDGFHPSLKTRHTITVSDGDKNSTNYVDIWYAPTIPQLSGESNQVVDFMDASESAYKPYSFIPTNKGNKARTYAIINKPSWCDFNRTTGEVSGQPSLDQNGSYNNIQIFATNDRGMSNIFKFNIKVADKTPPKKFNFKDLYGVEINRPYDATITVNWLEAAQSAPISISGYNANPNNNGYRVNGAEGVTEVHNGDVVSVWHISSNEYNTELQTLVTIGEESDAFVTQTKASADAKLPLIVGAPRTSANIHQHYSYTPQLSTDYSHFAPVTKPFTIENKPAWATFNTTTGELSGTPTAMGEFKNIRITAYGDNGLDYITFTIRVSNEAPSLSGENLSLENPDMHLSFEDNPDWRDNITEIAVANCYMQQNPTPLSSSDYTLREGSLVLHSATSSNVALHIPSMGGFRIIIQADGYEEGISYLDIVEDGQYAIKAILSSDTNLVEDSLDGANITIELQNSLAFKDANLQSSMFTLASAPEDLHIADVHYVDATHAQLTLAYDGIDFDSDTALSITIDTAALNEECMSITTNELPITAIIEPPFINILYPDDPTEDAKFGYSVAEYNGTIAVGAHSGVYIFDKGSDGNYTQVQKIPPLDVAEWFGDALAMDRDYLVIGDKHHSEDNSTLEGIALVYKRDAQGNYTQIADLRPTDIAEYDNFGCSVDISKDMIIVGAENALTHQGKAYLYKKDASDNFTLVETLTRTNGKEMDNFGHDVAITHGTAAQEDDYFIVVGALVMPNYDSNTNTTDTKEELGAGFANYYMYSNNTLSNAIVMSADDSSELSDHYGSGVALDGNLVIIASAKRLYIYSRGQDTALTLIHKIEDAGVGVSGKDLAINFTGFDNHARYVIVSGTKSFISTSNGSDFTAYTSHLGDNDNLGYSAALYGFEVVRGAYSNSDLINNGGAVLVSNAYDNITSAESSATTPPEISVPFGLNLSMDTIEFTFDTDANWANSITQLLYKAGAYANYVVIDPQDYTITDNTIVLNIATSNNVALHTPFATEGSLLIKADGYLDSVATLANMDGGTYAIKAEISSTEALKEDTLDGATLNISLSNTLAFADNQLNVNDFELLLVPDGLRVGAIDYIDATHAQLTLAFDSSDFDDNRTIALKVAANTLNSVGDITTNSLEIVAVLEPSVSTKVTAIDPAIVGAKFWYDKNGNGAQDSDELSTYSDVNGSATFSIALPEAATITMVESGLHNGNIFHATLSSEYNSSNEGYISPVTTLLHKGFSLSELRTILVDAGVDSALSEEELLMNPYATTLIPQDGNVSSYSPTQLAQIRRLIILNVALNSVVTSLGDYAQDKETIYNNLTKIYSGGGEEGEGEEGESSSEFTLLGKLIDVGELLLGDTNLKETNVRIRAHYYLALNNYIIAKVNESINDYGSDDGLYWLFVNDIDYRFLDMLAPMYDSFERALYLGVNEPKFEYVKNDEGIYKPMWMVTLQDLANVNTSNILIRYRDESGNEYSLIFMYNHEYYENFSKVGTWQIANNRVEVDNGTTIVLQGTKLLINNQSYDIYESALSIGSNYDTLQIHLPKFMYSNIHDGERYVDINESFVIDLSYPLTDAMKNKSYCSLSRQGYLGSDNLNITYNNLTMSVVPEELLKRNEKYILNCGISYGEEFSGYTINFTSEEMNIPIMKTLQTASYDENGDLIDNGTLKDDGYYQKGWSIDRSGNNTDEQTMVLDSRTNLLYSDEANNTNLYTHRSAELECQILTLEGYDDWRLPTVNELMSLARYDGQESIDNFVHLSTSKTAVTNDNYGYWTSERNIDSTTYNSDEYLFVTLPSALLNTDESDTKRRICVRQFETRNDVKEDLKKEGEIVIDSKNSIMWTDNSDTDIDRTWEEAINYCETLTLDGYDDWRLPNINELQRTAGHIKDLSDGRGEHSLNPIFTATNYMQEFWSSTTNADALSEAYILKGLYGSINSLSKTATRKTRCVRGGY